MPRPGPLALVLLLSLPPAEQASSPRRGDEWGGAAVGAPATHPADVCTAKGHYVVDGEPFFPLGFYGVWLAAATPAAHDAPISTYDGLSGYHWSRASDFWRDYRRRFGFNTFYASSVNLTFLSGLGLGPAERLLPVVDISSPVWDNAACGANFTKHLECVKQQAQGHVQQPGASFLAYAVQDEPDGSLPETQPPAEFNGVAMDTAISAMLRTLDPSHPSMINLCGVPGGYTMAAARRYASNHAAISMDAYTAYQYGVPGSPECAPRNPRPSPLCRRRFSCC